MHHWECITDALFTIASAVFAARALCPNVQFSAPAAVASYQLRLQDNGRTKSRNSEPAFDKLTVRCRASKGKHSAVAMAPLHLICMGTLSMYSELIQLEHRTLRIATTCTQCGKDIERISHCLVRRDGTCCPYPVV